MRFVRLPQPVIEAVFACRGTHIVVGVDHLRHMRENPWIGCRDIDVVHKSQRVRIVDVLAPRSRFILDEDTYGVSSAVLTSLHQFRRLDQPAAIG